MSHSEAHETMRRIHPEKVDLNAVAQSLVNEGIIDELDSSYYLQSQA